MTPFHDSHLARAILAFAWIMALANLAAQCSH